MCVAVTPTITSCDSSKHQFTATAWGVGVGAVFLGYLLYVISRVCKVTAANSAQ